jgi:hypothetical protein
MCRDKRRRAGSGRSSRERDKGFGRGTRTVSTNSGWSPRTPTTVWASKGCERGRGSSGRKRARVGRSKGSAGGFIEEREGEEGSPGWEERRPRSSRPLMAFMELEWREREEETEAMNSNNA